VLCAILSHLNMCHESAKSLKLVQLTEESFLVKVEEDKRCNEQNDNLQSNSTTFDLFLNAHRFCAKCHCLHHG
jgi:hypothetical protein